MSSEDATSPLIYCSRTWVSIIGGLLICAQALAERLVFHNIYQNNKKIEHELGSINHITQDAYGFMWFGSEKGLARYDGAETKIFRRDPSTPDSINHDFVRSLLSDAAGELWVATELGLCRYRARLESFACDGEHVQGPWPAGRVRALALNEQGAIYVGSDNGLYVISADRKQVVQKPLFEHAEPVITALAVDTDGTVWLGTNEHGLFALAPDGTLINQFSARNNDPASLVHNRISTLAVDSDQRLWVGTYGGGLSILDPTRTVFQNHVYQNGEVGTLFSNIISYIFEDSTGTIWLGVDQGGLVRHDRDKGFVATRHKPYDSASLPSNQVRTIFEDSNGDLWMGHFPSGVSFHNRATGHVQSFIHEPDNSNSLSHSAVLAVHQDDDGNIWVGTEDGLNLFDPQTGSFSRFHLALSGLSAKAVLSIAQYDQNTLWVGSWSGGLLAFDLITHRFTPINIGELTDSGKNSMFIWDIMRDRHGNMWVATEFDGLGVFDRAAGRFQFFSENDIPSNFVWAVMEDRRGAIWMATDAGVAVRYPGAAQTTVISKEPGQAGAIPAERTVALLQDRRGRIWVGSQDSGAFVYDPDSASVQHIGPRQGLPPGIISGFVEDSQGGIWILSSNGLINVDGESLKLQVFGSENGLAGNNFNRNAALSVPSGDLYIGGADGLNIFNPLSLEDVYHPFPVYLTTMRILNQQVRAAETSSPLNESMVFARHLQLDHRHTMFSFDFAALDYRHGQDTRFAYRLVGFDQNWNDIGGHRTATYTNIPPGDYQFQVRASRGKDAWIEAPPLQINIAPAPWRSGWAYTLYLALILFVGYLVLHYFQLRSHTRIYRSLSSTDALTGVSNRLGVADAAKLLISKPSTEMRCVLFIDVDHFKRINDTRGHDSGDRVLREVAGVIKKCMRRSDLFGRWGGEEFLVIYSHPDPADGLRLAERIRAAVADGVFDLEHSPLKVTLSIGCAFLQPGETFDAAVKRADQALYHAKSAGRNCIIVAEQ